MNQKFYDLTNPQKSIWYIEQVFEEKNIGNICGTLLIKEPVNVKLLKRTIELFIEKNDSMRINIMVDQGFPRQFVCDKFFF